MLRINGLRAYLGSQASKDRRWETESEVVRAGGSHLGGGSFCVLGSDVFQARGLCWTGFTRAFKALLLAWSLALSPVGGGGKLVWAESTIGNWIVITHQASVPLGALSLSVSNQHCVVGGDRDSIANPRWRAKPEDQQMGKFSFHLSFLAQMTLAAH